jgi:hypothetical protein
MPSFFDVVSELEALLDSKSEPLLVNDGALPVPGSANGSGFVVPGLTGGAQAVMLQVSGDGLALVKQHRERFLHQGATLFLREHGFGLRHDTLALAPSDDKFEVIRIAQTDAANYGHDNDDLIAWLRELDAADPFTLLGAGFDFVEGSFDAPVRDPDAVGKKVYTFCPDFWEQGIGLEAEGEEPEPGIAAYFRAERAFFFWWD